MFEENVRQFKTCLIAKGYPEQTVEAKEESSQTKIGDVQKYSTLYHTISTVISKLAKHT